MYPREKRTIAPIKSIRIILPTPNPGPIYNSCVVILFFYYSRPVR